LSCHASRDAAADASTPDAATALFDISSIFSMLMLMPPAACFDKNSTPAFSLRHAMLAPPRRAAYMFMFDH